MSNGDGTYNTVVSADPLKAGAMGDRDQAKLEAMFPGCPTYNDLSYGKDLLLAVAQVTLSGLDTNGTNIVTVNATNYDVTDNVASLLWGGEGTEDGIVTSGYLFSSVNLNYLAEGTSTGAPDVSTNSDADVANGTLDGSASDPYYPNINSPGETAGSVNLDPLTKVAMSLTAPNDYSVEPSGGWGEGDGHEEIPSETAATITNQKIGDVLTFGNLTS